MRKVLLWATQGDNPPGWEAHTPILWNVFEDAPGHYRIDRVERMLRAAGAPCHLELVFYMHDLIDHTPAHHKQTHVLRVGDATAEMPGYAHPAWQAAYYAAIKALAGCYRDDERVASFWLGPGLDQETQAIKEIGGVDWRVPAREVLQKRDYLRFIADACEVARDAWRSGKPVYLAAAPSPGNVWNAAHRAVCAAELQRGCRYRYNGWTEDSSKAVGYGEDEGLQQWDMRQHAESWALEEGPVGGRRGADRLYWMLLPALATNADFVCLGRQWLADVPAAEAMLPTAQRWLVFRDAEHPQALYTGANGKTYGHGGQPGPWAVGARLVEVGPLAHYPDRYDYGRWHAAGPVRVAWPGLAAGLHRWRIVYCDGRFDTYTMRLADDRILSLPYDASGYHRVEWLGEAKPEPEIEPSNNVIVNLLKRVAALENRVSALEEV